MRKREVLVGVLLAALVGGGVVAGGGTASAQARQLAACPPMPTQREVLQGPDALIALENISLTGDSVFSPLLRECVYRGNLNLYDESLGEHVLLEQTPKTIRLLCADEPDPEFNQRCGTIDTETSALMDIGVLNHLP